MTLLVVVILIRLIKYSGGRAAYEAGSLLASHWWIGHTSGPRCHGEVACARRFMYHCLSIIIIAAYKYCWCKHTLQLNDINWGVKFAPS